jgi:hypothetical protein
MVQEGAGGVVGGGMLFFLDDIKFWLLDEAAADDSLVKLSEEGGVGTF